MKAFSLLLKVDKWHYQRALSDGDASRHVMLTCSCDDRRVIFDLNGQKFIEPVAVDIFIAEPSEIQKSPNSEPIVCEGAGGPSIWNRVIKTQLGGLTYYPRQISENGSEEKGFLSAMLGIPEEMFLELLAHRQDLKRIILEVVGENHNVTPLDYFGHTSLKYAKDDKLHIIGLTYSVASSDNLDFP